MFDLFDNLNKQWESCGFKSIHIGKFTQDLINGSIRNFEHHSSYKCSKFLKKFVNFFNAFIEI